MEPPFPAVSVDDPVREAVELLAGDRQALLVTEDGRAGRDRHARRTCSRRCVRVSAPHAFATRAVHAGLAPDPHYGSVIPAIHQTSTFVQPAPGEFVEDYDYARTANPTRAALEKALGELEGGHARAFASGMAAEHALITAVCAAGDHVILPADLYGGTYRLVDKVLARWGLEYDAGRPDRPRRGRARAVRRRHAPDLGRDADQPAAERRRHRGVVARKRRRARRGRQHVRDAGQPAPARARRRRRGALDDEVPRRPLGHGRRRGDRARPSAARAVRFVQNAVGAVPGPLDCFLVHRGLRTLHLRMAAHAENARAPCATFLRERPGSSDVRWPGFSGMVSSAIPTRDGIARGRSSSRSPSRSAASSR